VSESAALLDAGSNAIGAVVDPQKVEELPMLGRNSKALVTLVPGVRATRQTTLNAVLESHYQFFSINGSRPNQSQFVLDGGNNTNLTFNGPEYSPQVEEVQEFRIQTSNFSAEYANSGGVINVASRSGTNHLHGSLFDYFRMMLCRRMTSSPTHPEGCGPLSATTSSVEPWARQLSESDVLLPGLRRTQTEESDGCNNECSDRLAEGRRLLAYAIELGPTGRLYDPATTRQIRTVPDNISVPHLPATVFPRTESTPSPQRYSHIIRLRTLREIRTRDSTTSFSAVRHREARITTQAAWITNLTPAR
jgi:hypothetical protein